MMPVYFLQPLSGGPVKIGHSADVDARHRQLESHYGQPLALLATRDGGRETEAEVHARFDHLRFGRTEQFRPAPELMDFIGRPLLAHPDPDAVAAMPSPLLPFVSVKIDDQVVAEARIAAAFKGMSLAEYLSETLRPIVAKDIEQGYASRRQASPEAEPPKTPKAPKRGR